MVYFLSCYYFVVGILGVRRSDNDRYPPCFFDCLIHMPIGSTNTSYSRYPSSLSACVFLSLISVAIGSLITAVVKQKLVILTRSFHSSSNTLQGDESWKRKLKSRCHGHTKAMMHDFHVKTGIGQSHENRLIAERAASS